MNYEKRRNSRVEVEYGSSKLLTVKDLPEFKRNFFYDPEVVAKHKKRGKTILSIEQLQELQKSLIGNERLIS